MKATKGFIKVFLSLALIMCVLSEPTGIRVEVSPDLINEAAASFTSVLQNEISKLNVPDQHFEFNAGLGKAQVDLKNVKFNVEDIPMENINVNFLKPCNIDVHFDNLKAGGSFKVKIKLFFYKGEYPVTIDIKSMSFKASTSVITTPSPLDSSILIPSVEINGISLDFDFDFEIHTSIIGALADVLKGVIKTRIKDIIREEIVNQVRDNLKQVLDDVFQRVDFQPKIEDNLFLDFSLLNAPYVNDEGKLVLNTKGLVFDKNFPETKTPPFSPSEIGSGILNKNLSVLVSEYVINSALYTLSKSERTHLTIESKDIPEEAKTYVDLNTTFLDTFFPGIKSKYGENVPVKIRAVPAEFVPETDGVDFTKGKIDVKGATNVSIIPEGQEEVAVELYVRLNGEVKLKVSPGADIDVSIEDGEIEELKLVKSNIGEIHQFALNSVKNMSNILAKTVGFRLINDQVLSKIKVKLPEFRGISIRDSEAKVGKDLFEIGVSPDFSDFVFEITRVYTQVLLQKSIKIEEIQQKIQKFLR